MFEQMKAHVQRVRLSVLGGAPGIG
jgi:hypothetical protein